MSVEIDDGRQQAKLVVKVWSEYVPERTEAEKMVSVVEEVAGRRAPPGTKSAMMAPPHIVEDGQDRSI